jgi:ribonucleoside-triphosphate reductase
MKGVRRRSGQGGVKAPEAPCAFLGQIVNSTFTMQGESAGAQACGLRTTPTARPSSNMTSSTIRPLAGSSGVHFNLNVPTRVGFHCRFRI